MPSRAGNLALIALSQMYSLMENLRRQLLVDEPIRAAKDNKITSPYAFQLRAAIGLPERPPQVPMAELGVLVDSRDPDILNRLATVERQFLTMIDVIHRHEKTHAEFQNAVSKVDPTGRREITLGVYVEALGAKIFIELDMLVQELEKLLPKTGDNILSVSGQLQKILRLQLPGRRFIKFSPARRSRYADEPPGIDRPAWWRFAARWLTDFAL